MSDPIIFTVKGKPISQGSPRIGRIGNKATILLDSEELRKWRIAVAQYARNAAFGKMTCKVERTHKGSKFTDYVVFDKAVVVYAKFYLPCPKKRKDGEIHIVPPDLDKLQRAIGDSLEDAHLIKCDSQIVGWPAFPAKVYSDEPRVVVRVEAWEG